MVEHEFHEFQNAENKLQYEQDFFNSMTWEALQKSMTSYGCEEAFSWLSDVCEPIVRGILTLALQNIRAGD